MVIGLRLSGIVGKIAAWTMAVLVAAVPVALASSKALADDDFGIYQMSWQARGVNAVVTVNGVPVCSEDFNASGFGSASLNIWLMPGDNAVTASAKALPAYTDNDKYFRVFAVKAQPGQYSDEGGRILEYGWTEGATEGSLPLDKKFTIAANGVPATELWTKGEVMKLDADTEKGAREYLKAVSDAYVKMDSAKVADILHFKSSEYARSMNRTPNSLAEDKKAVKEYFAEIKKSKAKYAPINAAKAKLDLVAGGRLIRVTSADGKPPLIAKAARGGEEYIDSIYLARIDGKWTIAR